MRVKRQQKIFHTKISSQTSWSYYKNSTEQRINSNTTEIISKLKGRLLNTRAHTHTLSEADSLMELLRQFLLQKKNSV